MIAPSRKRARVGAAEGGGVAVGLLLERVERCVSTPGAPFAGELFACLAEALSEILGCAHAHVVVDHKAVPAARAKLMAVPGQGPCKQGARVLQLVHLGHAGAGLGLGCQQPRLAGPGRGPRK